MCCKPATICNRRAKNLLSYNSCIISFGHIFHSRGLFTKITFTVIFHSYSTRETYFAETKSIIITYSLKEIYECSHCQLLVQLNLPKHTSPLFLNICQETDTTAPAPLVVSLSLQQWFSVSRYLLPVTEICPFVICLFISH